MYLSSEIKLSKYIAYEYGFKNYPQTAWHFATFVQEYKLIL
jgi:hypothetical protein